jgi:FMN reductase (NADPH)
MSNPVITCLMNHKSIRKYQAKPVESEKLDLILRAGTRAATAGNLQLYTLIVVDDMDVKEALDSAHAPLVIIALADQYRVRRWLKLNGVPNQSIYNNRALHLFFAIWDSLIALHNIVIAAESLDLGACYNGNVLSMDLQTLLGIPKYVYPMGMVSIGYPDETPELSMRLPLEAIAHRNSYHVPGDEELLAYYQERNEVWDGLPDQVKERLHGLGIHSIPQGVAYQKYRAEGKPEAGAIQERLGVIGASNVILENLARAGFILGLDT